MTINSYGILTRVILADNDGVTFSKDGLYLTHFRNGSALKTYYLGYINKVTFDTAGGIIGNMSINPVGDSSGVTQITMSDIVDIVFLPSVIDSSDIDGDGISNNDELLKTLTDPYKKDSDGDGYDDNVEIGLFGNGEQPLKYNPCIADQPNIQISLIETPRIFYLTTKGGETGTSIEIGKSTSYSTSQTETSSRSISIGVSAELMVGVSTTAGTSGGAAVATETWEFSATAGYSFTNNQTNELSNTASYEEASNQTKTQSTSENWSIKGAKITAKIILKNNGHLAYKIKNPVFALNADIGRKRIFVGNLKPDGTVNELILEPGNKTPIELTKNYESIDEVDLIGRYAEWFNVSLESAELKSKDDFDYTASLNTVKASCANIAVDFNGETVTNGEGGFTALSPIIAKVAVKTKYNPEYDSTANQYGPVKLGECLHKMGLNYIRDLTGNTISVNGVSKDSVTLGSWSILRKKVDAEKYDILKGPECNPDSLTVLAGESILLAYSRDTDRDSVSDIIEKEMGTISKNTSDFDGDGISDFAEVYGWKKVIVDGDTIVMSTDPANKDTDLDSLTDDVDPNPRSREKFTDVNLKTVSFITNTDTFLVKFKIDSQTDRDTSLVNTSIGARPTILFELDQPHGQLSVTSGNGNNVSIQKVSPDSVKGPVYECDFSSTIMSFIDNKIVIEVSSEDNSKTKKYTINFDAPLQGAATDVIVINDSMQVWRSLKVQYDPKKQIEADERTTGFAIFRTDTNTALSLSSEKFNYYPGQVVGKWVVVDTVTASAQPFQKYDSALESGKQYNYRIIPFGRIGSGKYYYYNNTTKSTKSTMRIKILNSFFSWKCIEEGDGSGTCEPSAATYAYIKHGDGSAASAYWVYTKGWKGIAQGHTEILNWNDSSMSGVPNPLISTLQFQESDTIITTLDLEEQDAGPNDVLWNDTIFKFCIHDLLTGNQLNEMGVGLGFTEGNTTWENKVGYPVLPTVQNRSTLRYKASKTAGSTEIEVNYGVSWWFE